MKMKKFLLLALSLSLLALCGCSGASEPAAQPQAPESDGIQYDYRLKAGETTEVYDLVFDKMVTVTVDPASTRDGAQEQRSNIFFDNCTFNAGLTIVGDYHAMVSLGGGCTFGENSGISCVEATSGSAKQAGLEDNLIKLFVACDGVDLETGSAMGVLSDGPDFTFNGTTYSKAELAPDSAFLAVYSSYQGDEMSYTKFAIGQDDSAELLE